jgi:hypothetical protein
MRKRRTRRGAGSSELGILVLSHQSWHSSLFGVLLKFALGGVLLYKGLLSPSAHRWR